MLIRVTAPAPIVATEEARQHLRIDHTDDDAYIAALVAAATAWIDGADGWLGRCLGPQTWDLKLDGVWWDRRQPAPLDSPWWQRHGFGSGWALRLPLPPLLEVVSIKYRDPANAEQTYDAANYVVSGVGASHGGTVSLATGAAWPSVSNGREAMTVRFRAGYEAGDPPGPAVPAPIKHAVLLMTERLYEDRGGRNDVLKDSTIDALLAPFRVFA